MHRHLASALLCLMAAFLVGQTTATAPARPDNIPKDWKQVDFWSRFTFWIPPDMKGSNYPGVDFRRGEYAGAGLKLLIVYESVFDGSFDGSRYKVESIVVDGRKATLGRRDGEVVVYFPRNDATGQRSLRMDFTCDKDLASTAEAIIRSISFTAASQPATTRP